MPPPDLSSQLQQPGIVDLLKQLTNFAGVTNTPTTATDQDALNQGLDPSSPDIVKSIATQITKIKAGGDMPDPETAKTLGAAFKAHLDYNANLNILNQLNKAYTTKYGAGQTGNSQ